MLQKHTADALMLVCLLGVLALCVNRMLVAALLLSATRDPEAASAIAAEAVVAKVIAIIARAALPGSMFPHGKSFQEVSEAIYEFCTRAAVN